MLRCPGAWQRHTFRWAGAKRPTEPPRGGPDRETGGGKALEPRGAGRLGAGTGGGCGGAAHVRAANLGGPPPARLARWWPWARPPADTVLPCSEHHARTRSARGRRGLRQEATREEGGINRERAKGRTPPPRPRWGWGAHGRKPKHHPRPQQVQGPRGARSLGTEKAPCPERAGAAGGQGLPRHSRWHVRQGSPPVWRPGGTSRAPLAPGPRSRALRRARSPPGLPCPWGPGQGGQPPPREGRRTGNRAEAHAAVSLSGRTPGLRPRADRAPVRSPGARLPVAAGAPPRLPAPRRECRRGGAGEGCGALTSRLQSARAASSRCSRGPGPRAAGAQRRRPGGAVRPT